MTMHLVGPYLTNLNYRKRKTTVTKAKMKEWAEDHRIANKENKRLGLPSVTFEDYVDGLHGRIKRDKVKFVPRKPAADLVHERSRKHREMYPSRNTMEGNTAKPERIFYTGERKLLGIAVMHKSNLVPVFDQKDAEDIARMRRG